MKNESLWRSETWIDRAFNNNNVTTIKIDYRKIINECNIDTLKKFYDSRQRTKNTIGSFNIGLKDCLLKKH